MAKIINKATFIGSVLTLALVGCGGFVYTTVGGSVQGLTAGSLLVLKNETNYLVRLSADGPFTFRAASDAAYNISVASQPNTDHCTVANGVGRMAGEAALNNIKVTCVPNIPVGGTLTGLASTTTLGLGTKTGASAGAAIDASTLIAIQGNGLTANGAFVLPSYIVNGYHYEVVVIAQPAAQVCTVLNGAGVADNTNKTAANNVMINCVAAVPISGTVAGLGAGLNVVLLNNGTDSRTVIAAGAYTFPNNLADGSAYAVTVGTQPVGQTCSVINATGVAQLSNPAAASNITVTCANK